MANNRLATTSWHLEEDVGSTTLNSLDNVA
jgi:hypothetical protein